MEDIARIIVSVIRLEYESAYETIPWDSETGDFIEEVPTLWELIAYELNVELQIENDEIVDLIRDDTIGTFHPNKRFMVIDLTDIENWKLPSMFDTERTEERECWFFLRNSQSLYPRKMMQRIPRSIDLHRCLQKTSKGK